MNRGDVWQLELGGTAGRRRALILTRQAVIPYLNKLPVAEITTKGNGYRTEVALGRQANLARESFVQLDNIQTVSKTRFVKYLGAVDPALMHKIGRTLVLALGLEDCV